MRAPEADIDETDEADGAFPAPGFALVAAAAARRLIASGSVGRLLDSLEPSTTEAAQGPRRLASAPERRLLLRSGLRAGGAGGGGPPCAVHGGARPARPAPASRLRTGTPEGTRMTRGRPTPLRSASLP